MARNKFAILSLILAGVLSTLFTGCSLENLNIRKETVYVSEYSELYEFLDANHHLNFSEDNSKLYEIQGILNSLGDPYTRINSFAVLAAWPSTKLVDGKEVETDEEFVGIGISYTYVDYEIHVQTIMEDSPAFEASIYPGDIIYEAIINNVTLNFKTQKPSAEELTTFLKNPEGTEVTLKLIRPNKSLSTVSLTISKFPTPTVKYKRLDDHKAYLKILEFGAETHEKFKEALADLETDVLKNKDDTLIIDLRDNPGGFVYSVDLILKELILKEEKTFQIRKTKTNQIQVYKGGAEEKKPYDIKIIVNEMSASASEIMASVLHYIGNYEVYGNPTFGKNIYQDSEVITLANHYKLGLTYTAGYWYYYDDGIKLLDKEKNPIPVTEIEHGGIYDLDVSVYVKDIEFDQVDENLIDIQKFLNIKYNTNLRTDGYMDLETSNQLGIFQSENNLEITYKYDLETGHAIYKDYYKLLNDNQFLFDKQVLFVLDVIE